MTSRDVEHRWNELEFEKLILINHFAVMYKNGHVIWPKASDARLKTLLPIKRNANAERTVSKLRVPMVDIAQVLIIYVFFLILIKYNKFFDI
jgi:hypothetical protein